MHLAAIRPSAKPRAAMPRIVVLMTLLLVSCSLNPAGTDPIDNAGSWKNHILPDESELRWASIPWLPSYSDGVREANRQGKPLLLWAMNGHPLGCT